MLDSKQEKELMKQVAKGSKSAFRTLALAYQKPLTSFCYKLMNNHEAFADDVVQQTLISWWQKASFWSPIKGSLKAWVFTIALNKCRDYLKRSHVHRAIEETDVVVESDHFTLKQKDQRDYILKAMNKLSEKQKQVVWLYYFADMKQKDIANHLMMSLKNVEVQIYRAKKIMYKQLICEKEDLL